MIQITAANKLKAKITANETIKATAATAAALTKATENLKETEARSIQENLRITNLEKSFKHQEQKTNEIANTLNKNNKNKNKNMKQKNSYGSHPMELMASPNKAAPPRLVDLTSEEDTGSFDTDPIIPSPPPHIQPTQKRNKIDTTMFTPNKTNRCTGETERLTTSIQSLPQPICCQLTK